MHTLSVVESVDTSLPLTATQAAELRRLGSSLASDKRWWGDPDNEATLRTVVRCEPAGPNNTYRIRISEAVGAIGLGDVQIIIRPKIPTPHLLHLLELSGKLPRVGPERAAIAESSGFFTLVARWFMQSCEILLRHDLIRDYEQWTEDLAFVRGRVDALRTARSFARGGVALRCTFSSFNEDNPLNRIVRAASRRVMTSRTLPADDRRRARRIHGRLDKVGPLRHGDLETRTDARTRRYNDCLTLSKTILTAWGTETGAGSIPGTTFLFRTPEAIEEGVRNALAQQLDPRWSICKRGRILTGGRNRKLNPDLVFGNGHAVGDIKYRTSTNGDIKRSELNQVTTFAAGYHATKATLVAFGHPAVGEEVNVGNIAVSAFNWDTDRLPIEAAATLADHIRTWLDNPHPRNTP